MWINGTKEPNPIGPCSVFLVQDILTQRLLMQREFVGSNRKEHRENALYNSKRIAGKISVDLLPVRMTNVFGSSALSKFGERPDVPRISIVVARLAKRIVPGPLLRPHTWFSVKHVLQGECVR